MDGRINPFVGEQEDYENSPENSEESPPSGMFNDSKMTSTSSPRRRLIYTFNFYVYIVYINIIYILVLVLSYIYFYFLRIFIQKK